MPQTAPFAGRGSWEPEPGYQHQTAAIGEAIRSAGTGGLRTGDDDPTELGTVARRQCCGSSRPPSQGQAPSTLTERPQKACMSAPAHAARPAWAPGGPRGRLGRRDRGQCHLSITENMFPCLLTLRGQGWFASHPRKTYGVRGLPVLHPSRHTST